MEAEEAEPIIEAVTKDFKFEESDEEKQIDSTNKVASDKGSELDEEKDKKEDVDLKPKGSDGEESDEDEFAHMSKKQKQKILK